MSIEIPDPTDPYWGWPADAIAEGARAMRVAPLPSHLDPDEARALVCTAAAAPAILESRVEAVARGLYDAMGEEALENGRMQWPKWVLIHERSQNAWRRRACKLLGLSDTGGEHQ